MATIYIAQDMRTIYYMSGHLHVLLWGCNPSIPTAATTSYSAWPSLHLFPGLNIIWPLSTLI